MVYRFQYILLKRNISAAFCQLLILCSLCSAVCAQDSGAKSGAINSEFFEVGAYSGVINVEDFGSEFFAGVNANFKATEDFFLQFNYMQTKVSLSSFERSQGQLFSGSDRNFTHYDFLVGYNLFQGEIFKSNRTATLSALYVVAGVGETDFGGEANFSYTLGLGYQVALSRKFILRFDYRDFSFKSSLLVEDELTHSSQVSSGISYLF